MSEVPDTVDDALSALGAAPTSEDIYFATEPFPAREIAASAAALALSGGVVGGGGGGDLTLAQVLANGSDADGATISNLGGIEIAKLTGATAATRYVGGTVSGAPVTGTFEAGDFVVTQDGHILVCTTAGSPGNWDDVGVPGNVASVFGRSGVVTAQRSDYSSFFADSRSAPALFYPENYGAVGDGVTDDTLAIQSAIDAAVAASGTVQFGLKTYLINTAPRIDRAGNAILALPTGYTGTKATVTLRGAVKADGGGPGLSTVLKTTRTDTYDNTHGQPSMFGGPTSGSQQIYMVGIFDIAFQYPNDPRISAVDLGKVAEFYMDGVLAMNNSAGPAGTTNPRQFGFRVCPSSNYATCIIGTGAVYGAYNGLILASTEHISITNFIVQWATVGLSIGNAAPGHTGVIQQLQTQDVAYHIAGQSDGSGVQPIIAADNSPFVPQHIHITQWDIEDGDNVSTVHHLHDTNNALAGHIGFLRFDGGIVNGLTNSGGSRVHWFDLTLSSGPQTIPAIPTTGGSFAVLWRDAVYYFSGGTVTDFKIGGTALGVTTGVVFVPAGEALVIDHSGAPTLNQLLVL